jgi:hypothetical protein
MHGVPVDLPLAAFIGFTLDQICLGQFQVQFHFGGEPGVTARISVEGGWELQDSTGTELDRDQEHFDRQHYKLHFLLGRTVSSFSIDAPRSFGLVFDSGHRLTVHDDNEHYETFSVHAPDGAEVYV